MTRRPATTPGARFAIWGLKSQVDVPASYPDSHAGQLAGVLVRKRRVPPSAGTFPTHTPLFVVLVIGVVLIVAALTFLPVLALGPIVEQLGI